MGRVMRLRNAIPLPLPRPAVAVGIHQNFSPLFLEIVMAYEMRVGQGQLFKSKNRKSEKSPNLSGKLMLPNGVVVYVSAWTKETAAGEKWISLQLGNAVDGQQAHQAAVKDSDEEIPF